LGFLNDLFNAIFSSTWHHIDVDFQSSAVAGTQLSCALDNLFQKWDNNNFKKFHS